MYDSDKTDWLEVNRKGAFLVKYVAAFRRNVQHKNSPKLFE
jgi:hypothetical protein